MVLYEVVCGTMQHREVSHGAPHAVSWGTLWSPMGLHELLCEERRGSPCRTMRPHGASLNTMVLHGAPSDYLMKYLMMPHVKSSWNLMKYLTSMFDETSRAPPWSCMEHRGGRGGAWNPNGNRNIIMKWKLLAWQEHHHTMVVHENKRWKQRKIMKWKLPAGAPWRTVVVHETNKTNNEIETIGMERTMVDHGVAWNKMETKTY